MNNNRSQESEVKGQESLISRSHLISDSAQLLSGTWKAGVKKFITAYCLLLTAYFLFPLSAAAQTAKPAETPNTAARAAAERKTEATAAALVTEFDVNGLKVLVKRREGSQTVAAGLFLRGGSRNITAENAGIESLMLAVATEASKSFPRERMRTELARMGTREVTLIGGEAYLRRDWLKIIREIRDQGMDCTMQSGGRLTWR